MCICMCVYVCIIEVPEEDKQNNGIELILKIIIQEKFLKIKDLNLHIERATLFLRK